jgi:hypothetical protein
LAAQLKAKEVALWGESAEVYKRIADNNNLIIINDLSVTYRMPFIPTNKEYLEEMVNKVRVWVAQGKLIVHPRCKMLLGCLRHGIWNKHRNAFERSRTYGHYDHLAALVYLIRNVDTTTNPIPALYDMDKNNSHVPAGLLKPVGQTATQLGKALLPSRYK